jgi:hypothetical protein
VRRDLLLERLDQFIKVRSLRVTHLPAYLRVEPSIGCASDIAPLLDRSDERVGWEIRIDSDFYRKHHDRPDMLRQILCHELAHIPVPCISHPARFARVAKSLGAGRHCGPRLVFPY